MVLGHVRDLTLARMVNAVLITLDEAVQRYPVSKVTLRKKIAAGLLPASKPGRNILVRLEDVDRLLAPVARQPQSLAERETPTARAERQLAEAGVR